MSSKTPRALMIALALGACDRNDRQAPSLEPVASARAAPSALPASALSMVHVPGGTFWMSDTERHHGVDVVVHPATSITVAAFDLDATEVTADAYMTCVKSSACPPPHPEDRDDPLCTALRPGYEQHPMTCVDWSQATAYCTAQHKRLPTETEWEYAAHGGPASTFYPWGNDEPFTQLCWSTTQRGDETCRVASFPRETIGTYDLAGNVREWTATAEAPRPSDPPSTIPSSEFRVVRGGSFGTNASHGILLHSVEWMKFFDGMTGFRCAR